MIERIERIFWTTNLTNLTNLTNPRNRRHKNQADVAPAGRLRFLGVCKRLDEVNSFNRSAGTCYIKNISLRED